MYRFSYLALAIILSLITGCAAGTKSLVWKNPQMLNYHTKTYIILPFDDRNAAKDKANFPEAAEVVRDAFETALLLAGYRCVESSQVKKELSKLNESPSFISEDASFGVGKKLGADAAIFGVLTAYYRGSFFGRYTTVAFSVKAVEIQSGTILWKATQSETTKWNYDYDPAVLATNLSVKVVEELKK